MVIELMKYIVFRINSFPPNNGISDIYSSRNIINDTHIDFSRHCNILVGAYIQSHKDQVKTNIITERS